jgi:hypothetical protein
MKKMKKVFQLIFTVAVFTVAISCGEKNEKKQVNSEKEEVKSENDNSTVLQLNNGNLWSANTETTQGINNMISLMNSFTEKESLEGYNLLKQNLEKEFGTIITECTMTGESHNQLHNFLIPIKDLFNGLESSDITICKANFNSLNKHLETYSTYFK